ncbi:ribosomal protein S18 acetylase RimI-like enzyme [Rhizobium aquaticum]|uniref:Ribosomal protein S18 acetylase RimI-like enzyme n=1 Tax=Rhizobium aquaticum TaxID=1549636 RepID=A0ABV2IZ74_9HYPH
MTTIRQLTEDETLTAIPQLTRLFRDTVAAGASLGYMWPFPPEEAEGFWRDVAGAVGRGDTILLVAEIDGLIEGTVQLGLKLPPNQPHRGDIKKLMVHPDARGRGLSRRLMEAAEAAARARGRSLLVLDTATGEPAEDIYRHLGWREAGTIPGYALFPDGRPCDTSVYYKTLRTVS